MQVSAVAPSGLVADYHAKVALLLGVDSGTQYLCGQAQVEGLVVRKDGAMFESAGFGAYRGGYRRAAAACWRCFPVVIGERTLDVSGARLRRDT